MSIKITCLQCGKSHKVNDRLAGKRVRCPECDTAVHVPELPVSVEAVAVDPFEAEPIEAQPIEAQPVEAEPIEAQPIEAKPIVVAATDSDPVAAVASVVGQTNSNSPVAAAVVDPGSGKGGSSAPPAMDDDDDNIPVRKERDLGELDMTPMVDVTFLLLIFFVVTASFQLQKSIMMPRQQTDAPSTNSVEDQPDELDQVELQIDEFGAFTVLASDWEAETPGKQNLISKLKEAQTDAGAKLIIKVHEQCMLQSLVDGMDAGTIADYQEIEVTQVDQFD